MSIHQKTAELRFAVIGELLNSPVAKGELCLKLKVLSEKLWKDPRTGTPKKYGYATVERWYYKAKRSPNPYDALMLKKEVMMVEFKFLMKRLRHFSRINTRGTHVGQ
ncbi:MAG: hypothetical protein IPJ71_19510 [Bdellovibrionales bacterium]|nr:hypothetical protein [Bdellovibrionales bacterium]